MGLFKKSAKRAKTWKSAADWQEILSQLAKLAPGNYEYEGGQWGSIHTMRQGLSKRRKELAGLAPKKKFRFGVHGKKLLITVIEGYASGHTLKKKGTKNGQKARRSAVSADAGAGTPV